MEKIIRRRKQHEHEQLLLSVRGTARRLGVAIETVKAIISNGELRFVVPPGRSRRLIPVSEIDSWIMRNLTKGKPKEKLTTENVNAALVPAEPAA